MRKRFLATLLALAMVLSVTPFALAEDGGKVSAPTASDNNFFANGTSITITAEKPEKGEEATFDGFTAKGTDAYISWTEGSATKYVGVNGNTAYIFGGSDGRESAVSVANTSITMTGGTVWNLFGGNYGEETADKDFCSTVEGNVNISLSGKAVVKNLLHGAGARNTCVKGTITMTFDDVDLSNETNKLYVNGGSWGNGKEGTRNIESGAMTTEAVANKVVIEAVDSEFYLIGGGGSGSTKVEDADVTLTNCEVDLLYLSGINGEVVDSSIVATNCKIGSFSATQRGFVGTGRVDLNGCTVTELNTGASAGCFSSDSGETDGSGVTGRVTYNIDASSTVKKAVLTPYVTRINNAYTNTFQNVTINKEGTTPLKLSVASFDADANATQKAFMVPEGSTLTLNNVETTIAKDNTLTNAGTIDMDEASKLIVDYDATLKQAGTVKGTVDGTGTVTYYGARVGNNGYESLKDALEAVKASGGTITLLQNATLETDITISKNITIDGQGKYKIDAQPKNSHAITVAPNAALTLKDVTLNITDKDNQTGTYGLDVQYGATLTLDNADVTLDGLSNATISSKPNSAGTEPGKFVLTKGSTITANNIGGNFSNGGDWTLTNSSIEIEDCVSNGFSCNSATLDNSTVSVSGAKLMGVTAKEITLKNDSAVTVEECGTDLPKNSNWATDGESYKHPVEIKKGGKVTIDSTSSMVLQNNANNNNTIYFVESTLDNNGTLQANVVTKAPNNSFSVTVKDGSTVLDVANVTSGETYTLPAALPDQGYNHFVGWNDGSKTHDAGAQVTITANTIFTAVWTYIPPANPSYLISVSQAEGGVVTANPTAAKKGDTVTLTVSPEDGYELAELTVTDFWGKDVALTANGDGTYTFTMPASQVEIEATFTQTGEPEPELPFTDVTQADWFYDEVQYVVDNGLMIGVSDTEFAPGANLTRAMLWTILARMDGETITGATWAQDARAWAMANGVSDGTDADRAVTREELVTMIWRYVGEPQGTGDLSGFADADTVSGWAEEAMSWSVGTGLIVGDENGLTPTATAIRAQIAAILMRFCENVAK